MPKYKIELVIESSPATASKWLEWLTSLVSEGFAGAEEEAQAELLESRILLIDVENEYGIVGVANPPDRC